MSNYIGGVTGEITIANQWKDHHSSLLNSLSNTADKHDVCKSFKNMCFNQGMYVTVTAVIERLHELSSGKASGKDGLTGESLTYANPIRPVLLSICFTCMFKHCYLPIFQNDANFNCKVYFCKLYIVLLSSLFLYCYIAIIYVHRIFCVSLFAECSFAN